jgi:hypothetical protein
MVQKGVCGEAHLYIITATRNPRLAQVTHRRRRLTAARAKGAKVLFPEKRLERLLHTRRVERVTNTNHPARQQRRRYRRVCDEVVIAARDRAVSGVEVLRYGLRFHNPNRWRQMGVSPYYTGFDTACDGKIEMNPLGNTVHTGIRATRTMHNNRVVRYAGKRSLQLPLHSLQMWQLGL